MFLKVVFNINLSQSFIYKVPESFKNVFLVFKRVLVPFKKKLKLGFAIEQIDKIENNTFNIEEILDILDSSPLISNNELKFYKWLSEYYIVPLGQIIFNALPPFSIDNFKIEIKSYNFANLSSQEKELLEKIKKNESLKKIQNNFPFFFTTLNNLVTKNIVQIKKKISQSRKIKFLQLNSSENHELTKIFSNQKILPLEIVKSRIKNYKKYLKDNSLTIIEKNREFLPQNFDTAYKYFRPKNLNSEQLVTWKKIENSLDENKFSAHLIFGVTGSGKTEIYLKAIEKTLKIGKSVIYLVPEISLTTGIAYILFSNFPNYEIGIFHSKISKNIRNELWSKINSGKIKIVIGARSALFAPVKNLGLIIVDEEHENSYKQEDKPRYHGRDCAVMKAKINNATVILGSATPSIQSYYNAKIKKYFLHKLKKRVNNQPLPEFKIVDLKDFSGENILTPPLKQEILKTISKKEQVILLINKKGYASFILCKDCGYIFKCKNCEVSLTYYKSLNQMICSYCDNRFPVPALCPICKSSSFKYIGKGTEKIVEQIIHELGTKIKIARFDGQSTAKHRESIKILNAFNNGEIDVIVGTQMIAKGYDFHNVSLVGIITVDNMLNFPDFNSVEKTFQLIIQCSGRAGRKNLNGKVLLQTFTPENYIFKFCKEYKLEEFYEFELTQRKIAYYPPFSSLAHLIFEGNSLEKVKKVANEAKIILNNFVNNDFIVLGPVESQIKKIRNKHRYSILIKSSKKNYIKTACIKVINVLKTTKGVEIKIDIDPVSLN